jgi:hypothetical protein
LLLVLLDNTLQSSVRAAARSDTTEECKDVGEEEGEGADALSGITTSSSRSALFTSVLEFDAMLLVPVDALLLLLLLPLLFVVVLCLLFEDFTNVLNKSLSVDLILLPASSARAFGHLSNLKVDG